MKKNAQLLRFLLYTFGIAWAAELTAILLEKTFLPAGVAAKIVVMLLVCFGAGMAPLYAVFLTRRHENPSYGIKSLWKDIIKTENVCKTFAVFAVIAVVLLGKCIFVEKSNYQQWYMWLPMFILMIPGGGLEEAGWRGYFFPELEKRMNFTAASLVQGIIWAVWHLPLWLVVNANQGSFNFFSFLLYCIVLSFELGLLIKLTHATWAAIVLHAWLNTIFGGMYTFSILQNDVTLPLFAIGCAEAAVCICVAFLYDKRRSPS